jgi:hypothetical protein
MKATDAERSDDDGRDSVTSVQGPVETVNGKLTLRIPMEAGGSQLAESARGVGHIDHDGFS